MSSTSQPTYAPPPGPPPTYIPQSLIQIPSLPFDISTFASNGWVSLPLRSLNPVLYEAYAALFARSQEYFDLPLEEKMKHHIPAKMQTSEEGFSVVEGEKSMISIRRASHCPESLSGSVKEMWKETGVWMTSIMRGLALSVGLPEDKFDAMVLPCVETLPESERVATLLRMFRYIRTEGEQPQIVSEGHRDLGLITLVVGHSPGLEAWDPTINGGMGDWRSIEERKEDGELCATLLSGQTLARLTNMRFTAGKHRVLVHPPTAEHPSPYRFSLVFALRAHLPVVVTSNEFTTPITGPFVYPFGVDKEVKMGDIYKAITDSHFNVNIDKGLRDEQRKKIFAQYYPPTGPPPQPPTTSDVHLEKESGSVEVEEKVAPKKKRWTLKGLFKRTSRIV